MSTKNNPSGNPTARGGVAENTIAQGSHELPHRLSSGSKVQAKPQQQLESQGLKKQFKALKKLFSIKRTETATTNTKPAYDIKEPAPEVRTDRDSASVVSATNTFDTLKGHHRYVYGHRIAGCYEQDEIVFNADREQTPASSMITWLHAAAQLLSL